MARHGGLFEEFLPGRPGSVRAHAFGLLMEERQDAMWLDLRQHIDCVRREEALDP
jgi:hypothetical protein